jgi:hypothetical protein
MVFTGAQRTVAVGCAAWVLAAVTIAGCDAADPTATPTASAAPTATETSPAASPTVPDPTLTTPAPDPAQPPPAAPTETPAPTPAAVPTEEESGWRWALIGLGGLAGLGLAYLLWRLRSSRRRWDGRFTQCCDRLRWVDDSLVPQVLAARSAPEAAAMWNGARTRVTAVDEELSALAGAPPTHARRDRAAALQQALGDLTTAVDADTAIAHTGDPGYLRASRTRIEQARARLSAELNRIMVS